MITKPTSAKNSDKTWAAAYDRYRKSSENGHTSSRTLEKMGDLELFLWCVAVFCVLIFILMSLIPDALRRDFAIRMLKSVPYESIPWASIFAVFLLSVCLVFGLFRLAQKSTIMRHMQAKKCALPLQICFAAGVAYALEFGLLAIYYRVCDTSLLNVFEAIHKYETDHDVENLSNLVADSDSASIVAAEHLLRVRDHVIMDMLNDLQKKCESIKERGPQPSHNIIHSKDMIIVPNWQESLEGWTLKKILSMPTHTRAICLREDVPHVVGVYVGNSNLRGIEAKHVESIITVVDPQLGAVTARFSVWGAEPDRSHSAPSFSFNTGSPPTLDEIRRHYHGVPYQPPN